MKMFWSSLKKIFASKPLLFSKILLPHYTMNETTNENYEVLSFTIKQIITVNVYGAFTMCLARYNIICLHYIM